MIGGFTRHVSGANGEGTAEGLLHKLRYFPPRLDHRRHHGAREYSILMEWLCDCPVVEPRK